MRGWVIIVEHNSHKATRRTYPVRKLPEVGKRPACTVSSVRWGIALYEAQPDCDYPTKNKSFFVKCQTLNLNLTFRWPCIVLNCLIIKPPRCTDFSNLFWNETLHVSGSFSVHHQEFFHCTHSSGICHTGLLTASCQQTCMTYTIAVCTVKKLLMMDRRTVRNM